jgi:hypothetical protein
MEVGQGPIGDCSAIEKKKEGSYKQGNELRLHFFF